MSIKRILLPVSIRDKVGQDAGFAFALARQHQAEVQGVFAQNAVWNNEWLDNWGLSEGEIEKLEQEARQKHRAAERQAEASFRQAASQHHDVKARFRSTTDSPFRSLPDLAVHADITVLGNFAHGENTQLNALLMRSARPLLVAPPRPVDRHLGKRIVIAWKQSQEAARAVAAAMPLIDSAAAVVIVSVAETADEQSVDPLQEYLSLHTQNVETVLVDPKGQNTGQVLVDTTAQVPGSILVMGAYSHRRWQEQVFGGVTSFVLNNADIPALMMH